MLSNDMSSKCTIHNNNFMVVLYAISIIVQHSPAEPRNFSVDDSSAVLRVRTTNLVPQTSLIKVARICFQIFPRKSNDPLPIYVTSCLHPLYGMRMQHRGMVDERERESFPGRSGGLHSSPKLHRLCQKRLEHAIKRSELYKSS